MFILVYDMNLKWLAGVDYPQRKKSEKLKCTKSGILANTQHQCFACCARKIHQMGNIFVSLL